MAVMILVGVIIEATSSIAQWQAQRAEEYAAQALVQWEEYRLVAEAKLKALPTKPQKGTVIQIPGINAKIQFTECADSPLKFSEVTVRGNQGNFRLRLPGMCSDWKDVAGWFSYIAEYLQNKGNTDVTRAFTTSVRYATIKYITEVLVPYLRNLPLVP